MPYVVFTMPSVINYQQTVGPVVFLNECAEMAVYLVLRLAGDIELNDFGMIMEAITEQSLKFFALRMC